MIHAVFHKFPKRIGNALFLWFICSGVSVALSAPPITPPASVANENDFSATAADSLPSPPDAAAQRKAAIDINKIFRSDVVHASSPSEKVALSEQLLRTAADPQTDLTSRYVLLNMATDLAAGAGDVNLAYRAIDATAALFKIDSPRRKVDVLAALDKSARLAETHHGVETAAHALYDEAMLTGSVDSARRALDVWMLAARRANDRDGASEAEARATKIHSVEMARAKVSRAEATLATNPSDPEANLAVGRFECFVLGNWNAGLRKLAIGSDATLSALAKSEARDNTPTDSTEALATVADRWLAAAAKESPALRPRIEEHAARIYHQALPGLKGLAKARIQERLAGLAPLTYDLGPIVSCDRHTNEVKIGDPAGKDLLVLTGFAGGFWGNSEIIKIHARTNDNSPWIVECRGAVGPAGSTMTLLPAVPSAWQIGAYHEINGDGRSLKMIRHDEGICIFAGAHGALRTATDSVHVYVASDGYWHFDAHTAESDDLYALEIKCSNRAALGVDLKEYVWRLGDPPVKMLSEEEGFCYLSGFGGSFANDTENVEVTLKDGFFYLSGSGKTPHEGRAIGVRINRPDR